MFSERLVIVNNISELRRMTQWLRTSSAAANIPQDLVQMLDVCANEAVSNIISYAYDDRGRHEINLALTRTDGGARLEIRDDGKPFNVLEVPEHKMPLTLADATVGGLGVHLIRRLMTHCDYRRDVGHNVLSLEAGSVRRPGNA